VQRRGGAGAVHPITEELEVRVLDPACAKLLVGQVVRVLEDRKPRHQPRRQRRLARLVRIDRAEPLLEKPPVDRCGEPRQRVTHVDDLVEPRLEEIALAAVLTLLRPHRESLPSPPTTVENHASAPDSIRKIRARSTVQSCKNEYFTIPAQARLQGVSEFFTDD
jgi:hypothetical protein